MIGELINKPTKSDASAKISWRFPPADIKPECGVVDVWLARLDAENTVELENIISDDERARADRFRFERDRKQFVAARAFLRIVLGKYLQINPREIRFEYTKYGKPFVGGERRREINFNLSHSDNTALFAVTKEREIGIDIERINSSFVDEQMLLQCLTRGEIEHFQTLSGSESHSFFFDLWTRKEAYLKACGNGLSLPPNQIEGSTLPGFSTLPSEDNLQSRQIFLSFQKLPAISGYAATLAVELKNPEMRFWRQPNADLS